MDVLLFVDVESLFLLSCTDYGSNFLASPFITGKRARAIENEPRLSQPDAFWPILCSYLLTREIELKMITGWPCNHGGIKPRRNPAPEGVGQRRSGCCQRTFSHRLRRTPPLGSPVHAP